MTSALVGAVLGALASPAAWSVARLADVPVDPDAPTARRWVLEELSRPEYDQQRSLVAVFLDWLQRQLDDLRVVGLPSGLALALTVLAVLLLAAVVLWVAGPVRRSRRTAATRAVRSADDRRDAAALRAAADAAERAGDHTLAVAERYRALVRGLEERTVLDEVPGRTAADAARTAGRRLPALAPDLDRAGALFDAVVYGRAAAGPDDSAGLRGLDERVRAARPLAPGERPAPADLVAP